MPLLKKLKKMYQFKEEMLPDAEIPFYKTERKTHPSFLRGWDVSDKG